MGNIFPNYQWYLRYWISQEWEQTVTLTIFFLWQFGFYPLAFQAKGHCCCLHLSICPEFQWSNEWNWYSSGHKASIPVWHTCACTLLGWVSCRQLELIKLTHPDLRHVVGLFILKHIGPSVCPSVHELYLDHTITHHRFELESSNIHQTRIMAYSQLVSKIEVLDLDVQGHFGHFDSEF